MTQQQQQPTAQEVVFYQDASPVYISSNRAVLLNQTFILRNIASVGMRKVRYYYINEGFFLIFSLGLLTLGFTSPMTEVIRTFGLVITGLLMLAASAAFILLHKPDYALLIGTSGGQEETVTSKDPQYITTLVNALNAALLTGLNPRTVSATHP